MKKLIEGILIIIMTILMVMFCIHLGTRDVKAQGSMRVVEATAYYDSYGHGYGADGRRLVEGLTIAGRVEDLGKTALVYDMDMRLIGIYEFRDTGYGQPTGYGKSKILKGRTVGTIESGTCVDIYMSTKAKCKEFGRQKVYIKIINAEG